MPALTTGAQERSYRTQTGIPSAPATTDLSCLDRSSFVTVKLVGHLVHTLTGRHDSAELVDHLPSGCGHGTSDLLALDADCVTYCASCPGREGCESSARTGSFGERENVVTLLITALFTTHSRRSSGTSEAAFGREQLPYWPQVSAPASRPHSCRPRGKYERAAHQVSCRGTYALRAYGARFLFGAGLAEHLQDAEMFHPGTYPTVTRRSLLAQGSVRT